MTTITELQASHGARPFGACTGCGQPLMVWADDPNQEPKDVAQGLSFCGPHGRGDYRRHTSNITLSLARQAVFLFGAIAGIEASTGLCTCCETPRLAFRYGGDREEWGHIDDQHFAEMRHIHVDSSSRDCDGRYDRGHVFRLNTMRPEALRPEYLGGEPTFHDLVSYVFRYEAPIFSGRSIIEVDTDEGWVRWSTATDEGGEAGEGRVCGDPWCAYDESHFRDHTAEQAGY